MYFDANNLSGWVMSESQPDGNFKLVKEYEYKSILDDIISTSQEDLDKRGYGYYCISPNVGRYYGLVTGPPAPPAMEATMEPPKGVI